MQWIMEEGYYTLSAGLSSQDIQAECTVYADIRSPYSYGEQTSIKTIFENEALRAIVRDFFNDKNLPWSAVLTSYQYTSQDKIGDVLKSLGCDSYCISELCGKFNAVKKL
jgi:beta-glucosidase